MMNAPLVYKNLSPNDLIKCAIDREEGRIASNGALCVTTGLRTGRSPKDRFIVKDQITEKTVDWGAVNQPIYAQDFDQLWEDALDVLGQNDVFDGNFQVGSHPHHHITLNVRCQYAWHLLFCDRLFINPEVSIEVAEWQMVNVANFVPQGERYNLPGKAAIVLDFTNKRILICGTHYAGEMKKAVFSVLNYFLPEQDILPMHCAATKAVDGNVTLFFGLSGTGKTTLSSDPNQLMIGDDEHGWGADGVFNFEGGCYAKCSRLSQRNEPLIWNAIRQGSVLENVVLDPQGHPDYEDCSLTENTRAAYPLDFIHNRAVESVHARPKNVIFLACDLFGVLPPIAKLTQEQAIFYFLSGYTALVGSTEVGSGGGLSRLSPPVLELPFSHDLLIFMLNCW